MPAQSRCGWPSADRVFEPFFRVDSARTDAPRVGLGLAIVRTIIQPHGGTIALDGNEPTGLVVRVTPPAG